VEGFPVRQADKKDLIATVTPIQASVTNPRFATRDLAPIAQGSTPTDQWTITDARGNAIDLSGKTLRLVAYTVTDAEVASGACPDPFDATLTAAFKYETGGSGIIVGGDNNNLVSITHSVGHTAIAGEFRYWLLNVTDLLPLANGKMPIKPAVWNA
jgi:hypothetical protein